MAPYTWIPGHGPDPQALARMAKHFPRPVEPMGEAWFMSPPRKMFTFLMERDVSDYVEESLHDCLWELTNGTQSFGRSSEWTDWLHYLMWALQPYLREGAWHPWVACLISAFMAIYPDAIEEPYAGFRDDALATLGRELMSADCWNDGKAVLDRLFSRYEPLEPGYFWEWYEVSGSFSSALFFCWKYLEPGEIEAWFRSVLDIREPHWRAQTLVWLLGVRKVLRGEITEAPRLSRIEPSPAWCNSELLHGRGPSWEWPRAVYPLLRPQNVDALNEAARRHITPELFMEWIDGFAQYDYLEKELFRLPDQFIAAFLEGRE